MNLPPAIGDLRVAKPDERPFHIWLPLFLLWPVLFVLAVVGLVVSVVADVVIWLFGGRFHQYTPLLLGLLDMVTESRGLNMHIRNEKADVDLVVW